MGGRLELGVINNKKAGGTKLIILEFGPNLLSKATLWQYIDNTGEIDLDLYFVVNIILFFPYKMPPVNRDKTAFNF